MATVFVTQQPRPNKVGWTPNLTPAAEFGKLRFVFSAEVHPYLSPQKALRHAESVLADFNPETDYILWPNTGDPIAAWACMITLAQQGNVKIQTLYFERNLRDGKRDNRNGFYTPVVFNLGGAAQW